MKLFEKNIGGADRALRLLLAVVLVLVGIFLLSPPWTYVIFLVALMSSLTGYTRTCGVYSVLGISTMEKKSAPRQPKQKKK